MNVRKLTLVILVVLAPMIMVAQGGDCGVSGWIGIGPTTGANCGCEAGCNPTYCMPVATGNCSRQTISVTLTAPPCYNGTVQVNTIECASTSGLDGGDYAQVGTVREDGAGNKIIDISDCVAGDPGASKTIDVTLSANRKDEVISYAMTCVEHNSTGCGGGAAPCSSVMPVDLIHFSLYAGDYARLEWATAGEVNNARFIVQRAGDNMMWEDLVEIDGAGDTRSTTDYFYEDTAPLEGDNLYRLLQEDFSGDQSFSHVISWHRNSLMESELRNIFPNPTSGSITLDLNTPGWISGKTTIEITNLQGQMLRQTSIHTQDGRFDYDVDVSSLTSGNYLMLVKCRDNIHHTSFVKK